MASNQPRAKAPGKDFSSLPEEDGDLEIEFEIPQGKVEELLAQLDGVNSELKNSFPLAQTAILEDLQKQGQKAEEEKKPKGAAAAVVAGFDPLEKLARLRDLQARYAEINVQREKAELTRQILEQVPAAGEVQAVPSSPPIVAAGNGLVPGVLTGEAPAPFPPPGGLPFPYAGVPGVLPPRVQPPPDPQADPTRGEELVVDDPRDRSRRAGHSEDYDAERTLVDPELLIMKDGLDMTFQHLYTHGQRMANTVRELSRQIEEGDQAAEVQDIQANREVMEEYVRQQRVIFEQQRVLDEAKWDRHVESETQWWVARQGRTELQHRIYGDKLKHYEKEDAEEQRYAVGGDAGFGQSPQDSGRWAEQGRPSSPQQQQDFGGPDAVAARAAGFDTRSAQGARQLTSVSQHAQHDAMLYTDLDELPGQSAAVSPKSHFQRDLPPSQQFRQWMAREGADRGWPERPEELQWMDDYQEDAYGAPAGERTRSPEEVQRFLFAGYGEPFSKNRAASARRAAGYDATERHTSTPPRGGPVSAYGAVDRSAARPRTRDLSSAADEPSWLAAPIAAFAGFGEAVHRAAKPAAARGKRSDVSPAKRQPGVSPRRSDASPRRTDPSPRRNDASPRSTSKQNVGTSPRAASKPQSTATPRAGKQAAAAEPSLKKTSSMASRSPRGSSPRGTPPDDELRFAAFAGERPSGGQNKGPRAARARAQDFSFGEPEVAREPVPRDNDFFGPGLPQTVETASAQEVRQKKAEESGGGGGLFYSLLFGEEDPEEDDATRVQRQKALALDPNAKFMPGACLETALPLRVPNLHAIKSARREGVERVLDKLMMTRRMGQLGDPEAAQLVLDYCVALTQNASDVVKYGDALRHVSFVVDVLNFYPLSVQIHLWGLDAIMACWRSDEIRKGESDSLAGPIFDAVSELLSIHEADPSLSVEVPQMSRRLLNALAMVLNPAIKPRLTKMHVDFALRMARMKDSGLVIVEHAMQVFIVARMTYRLKDQSNVAVHALHHFRAETKCVTRALLLFYTVFAVAVEDSGEEVLLDVMRDVGAESGLMPAGLRQIIGAMDLYAQDRKVQGAGALALMGCVTVVHQAAQRSMAAMSFVEMNKDGALRTAIYAQMNNRKSKSVALCLCHCVQLMARKEPTLLTSELAFNVTDAGTAFPRDGEVVGAALAAMASMCVRLKELCGPTADMNKLTNLAFNLVRMGEFHHKSPQAMASLLVTLAAAASDGSGQSPGGIPGEQFREVCGKAAAIAAPMRVLYEHTEDPELVMTAAIVIRCLTFDSTSTRAQAGRLRAATGIIGALARYTKRPEMCRELLAALANCAADAAVRQNFQEGLPDMADVIYISMVKCAREDPDVLAQGCRALGALSGSDDVHKADFDHARISEACHKVAKRIVEQRASAFRPVTAEAIEEEAAKLRNLSDQLLMGVIASGPQFSKIINSAGEPLIQCLEKRGPGRRAPESRKESEYYKKKRG
eukprot:TRINITY_DN38401_c0_g1_i1.p1 TRINITY_DN38401_c0_g1~~TRINITY_DN38401_c0_g1_i1.p1  ORF type:complete len:1476 (-),score=381.42 TRINITY_DN38401_c0_g1_i1:159-4586(-)